MPSSNYFKGHTARDIRPTSGNIYMEGARTWTSQKENNVGRTEGFILKQAHSTHNYWGLDFFHVSETGASSRNVMLLFLRILDDGKSPKTQ
jgi:hypothetical protein